MKVFIDTEFMEEPSTIELLSLGLVRDDGKKLYVVNSEADLTKANPWVVENVLPYLGDERITRAEIADQVLEFTKDIKPVFWGYYCDYDWVVFCWLFGPMVGKPEHFPMHCKDLKQWCDDLGNPKLPKQASTKHHALADAEWNRDAWYFLDSLVKS
jgi:hypothetical protein